MARSSRVAFEGRRDQLRFSAFHCWEDGRRFSPTTAKAIAFSENDGSDVAPKLMGSRYCGSRLGGWGISSPGRGPFGRGGCSTRSVAAQAHALRRLRVHDLSSCSLRGRVVLPKAPEVAAR